MVVDDGIDSHADCGQIVPDPVQADLDTGAHQRTVPAARPAGQGQLIGHVDDLVSVGIHAGQLGPGTDTGPRPAGACRQKQGGRQGKPQNRGSPFHEIFLPIQNQGSLLLSISVQQAWQTAAVSRLRRKTRCAG